MLNVAAELLLQISLWYTVMPFFFFNSTQTYLTPGLFINKACALVRKNSGILRITGWKEIKRCSYVEC